MSNSKRNQAIADLYALVSLRDQFTAEDWLEGVYPNAVQEQRLTKPKRKIEFPPELWSIIKSYAVGGNYKVGSRLYRSLVEKGEPNLQSWTPSVDNYNNLLYPEDQTLRKGDEVVDLNTANAKHIAVFKILKTITRDELSDMDDYNNGYCYRHHGNCVCNNLNRKDKLVRVKQVGVFNLKAYIPFEQPLSEDEASISLQLNGHANPKLKAIYRYELTRFDTPIDAKARPYDCRFVGILPKGATEYLRVFRRPHSYELTNHPIQLGANCRLL